MTRRPSRRPTSRLTGRTTERRVRRLTVVLLAGAVAAVAAGIASPTSAAPVGDPAGTPASAPVKVPGTGPVPVGTPKNGNPSAGGTAKPATTCAHRVRSDFNGDGYADLAVGEPFRTVAGQASAGAVRIFYGSATGVRVTTGAQYFDQNTANIGGSPTPGDEFGLALAPGYFNNDCYSDLAIGTPGEDDITILYGGPHGLSTTGIQQFAGRNARDGLGFALAAGDVNGDGLDDLVASAPYAGNGEGEITSMIGGKAGLTATKTWISQGTAGVPGVNEPGDLFGFSLAIGKFNADRFADVAIGTPFEDVGSSVDAGSVTVLKGSTKGVSATSSQLWTQDTKGVPGAVEAGDQFGYSLATGDINGDKLADLLIGIPGEDIGNTVDAGAALYLHGSTAGLTASGSLGITQNTKNVPGGPERGDSLGIAVAVGDFNGNGYADIALGVPGEDLTALNKKNAANAGSVDVLPGTAKGPTGTGSRAFSQDTAGVPGAVEPGDEFGSTLLPLQIYGHVRTDLLVGAQLEDDDASANVGSVTLLRASIGGLTGTRSQTFAEPGTGGGRHANDEFGSSLG